MDTKALFAAYGTLLSALGLALILQGGQARADVPPEPGYVETCTVEKQATGGKECVLCTGAFHGDPDACKTQYGATDYSFTCRTAGASVWKEVWCKGGQEETPPAPEPAKKSACAGGGSGAWLALALAGLVPLWRRRRQDAPAA